jgi:hypothetical protein
MKIYLAGAILLVVLAGSHCPRPTLEIPHRIGPTAIVTEVSSGLKFHARIDTGAASCSIHVDELVIADRSSQPHENIGKPIRLLFKNVSRSKWLDTVVVEYVRVRNSNGVEGRYKVPLTLRYGDCEKTVLVTLNNRQSMKYPLLIGRNFLRGEFVVDVEHARPQTQIAASGGDNTSSENEADFNFVSSSP